MTMLDPISTRRWSPPSVVHVSVHVEDDVLDRIAASRHDSGGASVRLGTVAVLHGDVGTLCEVLARAQEALLGLPVGERA